jgi:hypothetical protein
VNTSFSSASLQIGSRWERQNARLHIAHVAAGARISSRGGDLPVDGEEEWEERGIMVLLVKHVHLQNEGGAKDRQLFWHFEQSYRSTHRLILEKSWLQKAQVLSGADAP